MSTQQGAPKPRESSDPAKEPLEKVLSLFKEKIVGGSQPSTDPSALKPEAIEAAIKLVIAECVNSIGDIDSERGTCFVLRESLDVAALAVKSRIGKLKAERRDMKRLRKYIETKRSALDGHLQTLGGPPTAPAHRAPAK
jgi:hypothetical protein